MTVIFPVFTDVAYGAIVPEEKIQIIETNYAQQTPAWFAAWTEAQKHVLEGEHEKAIVLYEKLVLSKSRVTSLVWEYCQLLRETKNTLVAIPYLENLVEKEPENNSYKTLLAESYGINGKSQKAVELYEQLSVKAVESEDRILYLKGAVSNLKQDGDSAMRIKFLRELALLLPEDLDVHLELARSFQMDEKVAEANTIYGMMLDRFVLEDGYLKAILNDAGNRLNENLRMKLYEQRLSADSLTVLEKYDYQQKLSEYYLRKGEKEKALVYLVAQDEEKPFVHADKLLSIGEIYFFSFRRVDKALYYFERYLEIKPDDKRVREIVANSQKILAEDFQVIVENDGAALLWEDLDKLTTERKTLFLVMLENLEKKNHKKGQREIIEVLLNHYPDDIELITKKAVLLSREGQYRETVSLLDQVDPNERKDLFYLKADSLMKVGRYTAAYKLYYDRFSNYPEETKALKHGVYAAIKLDDARKLKNLLGKKREYYSLISTKNLLDYVEILIGSGNFDYTDYVIEYFKKNRLSLKKKDERNRFSSLVLNYCLVQEMDEEAEQYLRNEIINFNQDKEKIIELIAFLAKKGKAELAAEWLQILQTKYENNDTTVSRLDLLFGEKEYKDIIEIIDDDLAASLKSNKKDKAWKAQILERGVEAALAYGRYTKAVEYAKRGRRFEADNQTFCVSSLIIRKNSSAKVAEEKKVIQPTKYGVARFLTRKHIFNARKFDISRIDEDLLKNSLGELNQAKYALLKNDLKTAADKFSALLANNPKSSYYKRKLAEIFYRKGRFEDALVYMKPQFDAFKAGKNIDDFRRGITLARVFWAERRWESSLQVYSMLRSIPAENKLQQLLKERGIEELNYPRDVNFWSKLTFQDPNNIKDIDIVMSPEFLMRNHREPMLIAANELYDDYLIEQKIVDEYTARKALFNKDYIYAESRYEYLLGKEHDEEALLDLASIYHRLGKYGKEAEIYAAIINENEQAKILEERLAKNRESRKSRLTLDFAYMSEEGRNNYKNITETSVTSNVWFETDVNQSIDLAYTYSLFSDSSIGSDKTGHTFFGKYGFSFFDTGELEFGAGAVTTELSETKPLYMIRLSGQLDEHSKTFIQVEQQIVKDNLETVADGTSYNGVEIGFEIDSIPRILLGAEFEFRQYDDDNLYKGVHYWSELNIYREKFHFGLRYDGKYAANEDSSENENGNDEVIYWSPDEYQSHSANIHLAYLFKGNESFGDTPGYLSGDYTIGYEDPGNMFHKAGVNIFLEISDDFLLKGSLSFLESDDYEKQEGLLSFIYRW